MSLFDSTALEIGEKIVKKEISVREATESLLDSIEARDGDLNAYISVSKETSLRQADEIQKKIDAGELKNPLAGVPVAIKDNICINGEATTCASKMLESFRPPYDATVVQKLKAIGAPIVGKLNMDEFAMGSTTETSYFGKCKNPWDITRAPGGSSGGAAAAVAAREAYYALGSDTGGSIRQPCAFCGVTGIKPTYGTVSRFGLIAFASSLDQIGPVARSAKDLAAVLDVISGRDLHDGTSVEKDITGCLDSVTGEMKGKKIGLPSDYFAKGLDGEVKDRVLAAAKEFENMGAIVEEFPMPMIEYAIPAYYIISSAEASSNLSRYDGIKYGFRAKDYDDLIDMFYKSRSQGFGAEVKRRIMLGNFVLSSGYYDAYYKKALKVKALIKKGFDSAFEKYDFILGPTAPTTATPLGAHQDDPLKMYLGDIYTVSVNLAGLPGLVTCCGFDSDGLPVGMQLIGKPFGEKTLLNAAYAYEQATEFHKASPYDGKEA